MKCEKCGNEMTYKKSVWSEQHAKDAGYSAPLVEEWHKCLKCGYSIYGRSEID